MILIAEKKGFDALNATQKISALCKVMFAKKWFVEMVIFGHFDNFRSFWLGFLDFFQKQYFAER